VKRECGDHSFACPDVALQQAQGALFHPGFCFPSGGGEPSVLCQLPGGTWTGSSGAERSSSSSSLRSVWRARRQILSEAAPLTLLGALGMGVCGAFVYIGADSTSATNIGLIYATSPALIIVISRWVFHERLSPLQWAGVALALGGMLVIVFRGSLETLLALRLTEGDLWIAASALAWAVYSVLLQARPGKLEPGVRFAAIILFGTLVLAPFLVIESLFFQPLPLIAKGFAAMLFLAIVPALGAYGSYAYMQRYLGASKTGLILYLSPVYTALLAWLLLGEALRPYHLAGAACVLPGIWLATRKARAKQP